MCMTVVLLSPLNLRTACKPGVSGFSIPWDQPTECRVSLTVLCTIHQESQSPTVALCKWKCFYYWSSQASLPKEKNKCEQSPIFTRMHILWKIGNQVVWSCRESTRIPNWNHYNSGWSDIAPMATETLICSVSLLMLIFMPNQPSTTDHVM